MLSRWLYDYYKGYVAVTISGKRLPLLLNLANDEELWIQDIVYRSNGTIQMTILRSDIRRLIPLLRQTKSKIRFGKRTGLPFLVRRARVRKMFLIGSLFFLALLYSLTSVIWSIQVEGTKKLSPETVLGAAQSVGIHKGAWIGRLPDNDILQAEILDKVPELSWVGVIVQGTSVKIQVVEKIPPVEPQPTAPQNIVAKKKGIVDKILVSKGIGVVKKGQLVNSGDILISGSLGESGPSVRAKGIVEAEVWYSSDLQVPLEHTRKQYTGESFKKNYVLLGQFPIQIWGYGQNPYAHYEELAVDHLFHVGPLILPIKLRNVDVKETRDEKISLTEEEAKNEALNRVRTDITSKIGENGRIISQKILHQRIEHGKLYTKVLSIVMEDIGKPQPF